MHKHNTVIIIKAVNQRLSNGITSKMMALRILRFCAYRKDLSLQVSLLGCIACDRSALLLGLNKVVP